MHFLIRPSLNINFHSALIIHVTHFTLYYISPHSRNYPLDHIYSILHTDQFVKHTINPALGFVDCYTVPLYTYTYTFLQQYLLYIYTDWIQKLLSSVSEGLHTLALSNVYI